MEEREGSLSSLRRTSKLAVSFAPLAAQIKRALYQFENKLRIYSETCYVYHT